MSTSIEYCTLIINAFPMAFPVSWVKESYSTGFSIQKSNDSTTPDILLLKDRTLSIEIDVLTGTIMHSAVYATWKQLLIQWMDLTQTTNTYTHNGKTYASGGINLGKDSWIVPSSSVDSMSEKKEGIVKGLQKEEDLKELEKTLEDAKEKNNREVMEKVQKTINSLKEQGGGVTEASKFYEIPSQLQVSCAYFGIRNYLALGYLVDFKASCDGKSSTENISIQLMQFNFRKQTDEEIKEPEGKKMGAVRKGKIKVKARDSISSTGLAPK